MEAPYSIIDILNDSTAIERHSTTVYATTTVVSVTLVNSLLPMKKNFYGLHALT